MRFLLAIWIGLVFGVNLVRSEETLPLLKVGIFSYTNVTVTSVTATDMYFTHDGGMGNARLSQLSPDLQKKFGYEPPQPPGSEKQPPGKASKPSPARRRPIINIVPPDTKVAKESANSYLGKKPPELVVQKWLTDTPDSKGKFVLVDFWATWCGPCRQSIPHLNKLQEQFRDKLVVVGLSDETEQAVRKMNSPKIEYAVGVDPGGTTSKAMNISAIPHAILMDPNGLVRFEGHPGKLNEKILAGLLAKYSK